MSWALVLGVRIEEPVATLVMVVVIVAALVVVVVVVAVVAVAVVAVVVPVANTPLGGPICDAKTEGLGRVGILAGKRVDGAKTAPQLLLTFYGRS